MITPLRETDWPSSGGLFSHHTAACLTHFTLTVSLRTSSGLSSGTSQHSSSSGLYSVSPSIHALISQNVTYSGSFPEETVNNSAKNKRSCKDASGLKKETQPGQYLNICFPDTVSAAFSADSCSSYMIWCLWVTANYQQHIPNSSITFFPKMFMVSRLGVVIPTATVAPPPRCCSPWGAELSVTLRNHQKHWKLQTFHIQPRTYDLSLIFLFAMFYSVFYLVS